jgi:hypothetical protein
VIFLLNLRINKRINQIKSFKDKKKPSIRKVFIIIGFKTYN